MYTWFSKILLFLFELCSRIHLLSFFFTASFPPGSVVQVSKFLETQKNWIKVKVFSAEVSIVGLFFSTLDSLWDFTARTVYPSGTQWLNDVFPKKMLFLLPHSLIFQSGEEFLVPACCTGWGVSQGEGSCVILSVTSPIVLYKRRPPPVSVSLCWLISLCQLLAARSQETSVPCLAPM